MPDRAAAVGVAQSASEAAELKVALSEQQAALANGDISRIREKSTALYASAARELAATEGALDHPAEAIALYRRAVTVKPTVRGRLELASALLRTGDPKAAADEALTATEIDPQDSRAWAVRGGALRAAKREKDAVVAFEESLRLHPNADVAYALGGTLLALHEKAKADALFAQILKASGDDPIWYVEVGDAYREAEYRPEAILAFQEAIRRDPRVAHAEFFLGLTYLESNQWGPSSDSFRHLREAVRLAPRDYVSNFYLGALESTDGSDLASSDRHLRTAAEVDATQPEVWLYLGLNANREHRTAEAKVDLRRAIDLTGKDEPRNNYQVRKAYFALGRLLIAEGNRGEGAELLTRYRVAEQAAVAESGSTIRSRTAAAGGDAPATIGDDSTDAGPAMAELKPRSVLAAIDSPATGAVSRGLAPEMQRSLAEREAVLRHVLATSGNDLGTAQAREQRYDEALKTFADAVSWETPAMPALLRNEGAAAFRLAKYDQAAVALAAYFDRLDPTQTRGAPQGNAGTRADARERSASSAINKAAGEAPSKAENNRRAGSSGSAGTSSAASDSAAGGGNSVTSAGNSGTGAGSLGAGAGNSGAVAGHSGAGDSGAGAVRSGGGAVRSGTYAGGLGVGAGDERARMMLAMSEFSLGRFADASRSFAMIAGAAQADSRAAYAWAYALARTGQAQEANRLARDLAQRPLPIDQRMLACHLFVETEDYEGSASCYRRAYAEDATVRLAHFEVGEALVRLDRAAEALPELRAELRLSPEDANVQYALAYALLQGSEKDEAQRMLERLAREHPEQAEARYQLGKLLLEQGKAVEAIGHLEASERASGGSLEAAPDYVHYQLGTAYRKAGRAADADRELKLYREIKDRKRGGSASRD